MQSHAIRQRPKPFLTAVFPDDLPTLNPFAPVSESEAQILDLLHAPLIQIGQDGKLAPALAERWTWSQQVTCWYANAEAATNAAQRLQSLNGNEWVTWKLDAVKAQGSELVLRLSDPAGNGADEALRQLTDAPSEPLFYVRLRSDEADQDLLQKFAAHEEQASNIKRIWFDPSGTCELVSTLNRVQLGQKLDQWCEKQGRTLIEIQPVAELRALQETVLEFHLQENAKWRDGQAITAEDVRATVHAVTHHRQWSIPNPDAYQHIQAIEGNEEMVRVIYRKRNGSALMSWTRMPILPAAWLNKHSEGSHQSPPGAGRYQIASQSARGLLVTPVVPNTGASLEITRALTPLQIEAGLSTNSLDFFWSGNQKPPAATSLSLRHTAPRARLLVMWNTKSEILSDLRLRKALALATNREELIRKLLDGTGRIEDGLFDPRLWFAPKTPATPFAPADAQALLSEAGWLKGVEGTARKPGQALDIELLTAAGNPERDRLAKALAEQWGKIGVKVQITALPQAEIIEKRLSTHDFDAVILGQELETSWDVSRFWHSSQTDPGGLNFSGLANAEIDLLLEALTEEFDLERIPARARLLEERLRALYPTLPLFSGTDTIAVQTAHLPESMRENPERFFSLRELLAPTTAGPVQEKMKVKMLEPEE